MGLKRYNGWDGKLRERRSRQTRQTPKKKAGPEPCEICGSTRGLTFHAEEYGSTVEAYQSHWHSLCAYHHGMMHVRMYQQNRWRRMLHRIGTDTEQDPDINSLGHFFSIIRTMRDLSASAAPAGIR